MSEPPPLDALPPDARPFDVPPVVVPPHGAALAAAEPADAPTRADLPVVPPTPPAAAPGSAPAPDRAAAPTESAIVTCPECGTVATATLNRRDSRDFCRNCDYPLFWTPSKVQVGRGDVADDSLRRLPGTQGRATLASLPCPHCAEPNPLSGVNCLRCGLPLRPVAAPPPPPPEPVHVPPPPPAEAAPPPREPWWPWVLLGLMTAAIIVIAVLLATGTIG